METKHWEEVVFTKDEIIATNPFVVASLPERFQKCAKNLLDCTDKQLQDFRLFLSAVREDKGIPQEAEYKTHINPKLQSTWNGARWQMEHLEEVIEKQSALMISRGEYQDMIEEARKVFEWVDKVDDNNYAYGFDKTVRIVTNSELFWNTKYLGKILGLSDVDSDRIPFSRAWGKLVGVAQIEDEEKNTLVLLIDMKDKDGYHVLLPVLVNFNEDFTLPKGTKCLGRNMKDGPAYTLPKDLKLGPLLGERGVKITKDDVFNHIGKMVAADRYIQPFMISNTPSVNCFSPGLNLEMAGGITWNSQPSKASSPWTEK